MSENITAKTGIELRDMAAQAERRAWESFERSDTDGYLSQWASGITAQLYRQQAEVADNGGRWEFAALFDLAGELVPAKYIETRYGMAWALLESDDPRSRIVGWFNPSRARNDATRRANDARKGYYVGRVAAPAKADTAGATTVYVGVFRTDGGFSRDVQIIDNGQRHQDPGLEPFYYGAWVSPNGVKHAVNKRTRNCVTCGRLHEGPLVELYAPEDGRFGMAEAALPESRPPDYTTDDAPGDDDPSLTEPPERR
jgi:hypothetical protein